MNNKRTQISYVKANRFESEQKSSLAFLSKITLIKFFQMEMFNSSNLFDISSTTTSTTNHHLISNDDYSCLYRVMDHHQTLKHHSNAKEVSYVHDSIDMDWNIQCDLSNPESSSTSSEKRQTNHHRQSSGTLKSKSTYKHIPHREKPVHLVAKRNARERKRVQAVNMAFMRLRRCVPVENRTKRLSKVKTLHRAIEYIAALDSILKQDQISNATKDNIINENDQCSFRSSLRPATMIINDDDNDQDQCIMLNPQSNNNIHSYSDHHQQQCFPSIVPSSTTLSSSSISSNGFHFPMTIHQQQQHLQSKTMESNNEINDHHHHHQLTMENNNVVVLSPHQQQQQSSSMMMMLSSMINNHNNNHNNNHSHSQHHHHHKYLRNQNIIDKEICIQ